jgi:hypothetical protein
MSISNWTLRPLRFRLRHLSKLEIEAKGTGVDLKTAAIVGLPWFWDVSRLGVRLTPRRPPGRSEYHRAARPYCAG